MNYKESVDFISSTYKFGKKLGLENISRLLNRLGNPQDSMKIIHVAGTNGKGSTCSIFSSILVEEGYKIGLYTSPYLEVFNERFRINNENASDDIIAKATTLVRSEIEKMMEEGYDCPSEFEVTTAVGFVIFQLEEVEVVVLEVGLGGRLDATNVVKNPLVTIITSISEDHVEYLGNTLGEIASEKAGIIKENRPLVLYPQDQEADLVIRQRAKELAAPIYDVDFSNRRIVSNSLEGQVFSLEILGHTYTNLEMTILGDHQINNATTALTAIEVLKEENLLEVSEEGIREGLKKAKWAGRFEVMKKNPLIIIDGAHNLGGAEVFSNSIKTYLSDYEITLVLGILSDKDYMGVLDLLLPLSDKIVTLTPDSPRALKAEDLANLILEKNKMAVSASNVKESYDIALDVTDKEKGAILYAGSLYMIGEVRTFLRNL